MKLSFLWKKTILYLSYNFVYYPTAATSHIVHYRRNKNYILSVYLFRRVLISYPWHNLFQLLFTCSLISFGEYNVIRKLIILYMMYLLNS